MPLLAKPLDVPKFVIAVRKRRLAQWANTVELGLFVPLQRPKMRQVAKAK